MENQRIYNDTFVNLLAETMEEYNIDFNFIEKITGIEYKKLEEGMKSNFEDLTLKEYRILNHKIILLNSFKLVSPLQRICANVDLLKDFGIPLDLISKLSNIDVQKLEKLDFEKAETIPELFSFEELFYLATNTFFLYQQICGFPEQNRFPNQDIELEFVGNFS